jgi:ribonucleoside-diphosphate reductase alpha chain
VTDADTPGPRLGPQPISVDTLRRKYAAAGERDLDGVRRRVARALAASEPDRERWERVFYATQRAGFIPGGRINAAAGIRLRTTLVNCFVQPLGDSIGGRDGEVPGIYPALQEAAETLRRGGGVGLDFSALRPKGALVHSTASLASGPVSFMRLFDRSCETLESAGARRGAQMAVLRADHPDIERFIQAKDAPGELANFNLSVAATDAFLKAVVEGRSIELIHGAEPGAALKAAGAHRRADGLWVYGHRNARELFATLVGRAHRHGDPGLLFIDRINAENNLAYLETIEATNPCGEQPLPPYGCCCLGSFDLTRFVRDPFSAAARFDFESLRALVPAAVRLLDNVLDLTLWPLPQQRAEALAKRRVGLGLTGLGDALILLGLPYDGAGARDTAAAIVRALRDTAYEASVALARERGPFPAFDPGRYGEGPFIRRLPDRLQEAIRTHGIRNSHLISIAPTGTISLAFADNASNGIEPAYAWSYRRRVRVGEETQEYQVLDPAYRWFRARFGERAPLPESFVSALQVGPAGHLEMVAAVAPYVDAGISKTLNLAPDHAVEGLEQLYLQAWRLGLKGLATFRASAERAGVLQVQAPGGRADPATPWEQEPQSGPRCPRCDTPGPGSRSLRVDGTRPEPHGSGPKG